jgi:hypothetical protein
VQVVEQQHEAVASGTELEQLDHGLAERHDRIRQRRRRRRPG